MIVKDYDLVSALKYAEMHNPIIIRTGINSVEVLDTCRYTQDHLKLEKKSIRFSPLSEILNLKSAYNKEDSLLVRKRIYTDLKTRYSKYYNSDILYLLKQTKYFQIWGKLIINSDFRPDLETKIIIAASYGDFNGFHLIDLMQSNLSDFKSGFSLEQNRENKQCNSREKRVPTVTSKNKKKIRDRLITWFSQARYLSLNSELNQYLARPEFNVMYNETDCNFRKMNEIAIALQAMYGDEVSKKFWKDVHGLSILF